MSGLSKREKYALKLKMAKDVLAYVRRNPRTTTKQIFLDMIKKNPYYALLIFSQKVDLLMGVDALGRLEAAKTQASAKRIVEGSSIVPIMTKKAMRRSLMADLKRILEKEGEIIYGSGMFGQVHEQDLTDQDAAMWLAPRLSQLRHESSMWNHCANKLKQSRKHPQDSALIERITTNIRDQRKMNDAHESVGMFFRRPN